MIIETNTLKSPQNLLLRFQDIRSHSVKICAPLATEDYVVQPIADVSPPKWHLGHTTWFFETFILSPHLQGYQVFNDQYNFVFNSYYETVGNRVIRTDRGNLSRPTVAEVYLYRAHVDKNISELINSNSFNEALESLLELGLNHEQQHQELLLSDIKYILGHNQLFPIYSNDVKKELDINKNQNPIHVAAGVYEIGYEGTGFCFDNELNHHKIYLNDFEISSSLVTNAEYLEFINHGGYQEFSYWHAEGWDWVNQNNIKSPLYWHFIDGEWMQFNWSGLQNLGLNQALCHVNFFEASAFANWKGMRLPTEGEWEVASDHFDWGERWEWTNSAYLPYPGFKKVAGAIGEYNGKFMVNQQVLRGASIATPKNHSRKTYRNFFNARLQWQFTGIRLAK